MQNKLPFDFFVFRIKDSAYVQCCVVDDAHVADGPRVLGKGFKPLVGNFVDIVGFVDVAVRDRFAYGVPKCSRSNEANGFAVEANGLETMKRHAGIVEGQANKLPLETPGAFFLKRVAANKRCRRVPRCKTLEFGQYSNANSRLHRRVFVGKVCVPVAIPLLSAERVDCPIPSVCCAGFLELRVHPSSVLFGYVQLKSKLSDERQAQNADAAVSSYCHVFEAAGEQEIGVFDRLIDANKLKKST